MADYIGGIGAGKWAWTLALAVLRWSYGTLIFAFRVVSPDEIRPAIGNLLRLKG
jgi:hypothetical protein